MSGCETFEHAREKASRNRVQAFRIGNLLLAAGLLLLGAQQAGAQQVGAQGRGEYVCHNANLPPNTSTTDVQDLKVTGSCKVHTGLYYYGNVNIIEGGDLLFRERGSNPDERIDFWASAIIIENLGQMSADSEGTTYGPFGLFGGTLTIHLFGKNEAEWSTAQQKFTSQNTGAFCKSGPVDRNNQPQAACGIPEKIWDSNGSEEVVLPIHDENQVPIKDYFYRYGPLHGDGKCSDGTESDGGKCRNAAAQVGYFGNKVLAVSFGGSLALNGYKGASHHSPEPDPTSSGVSWVRLNRPLEVDAESLRVDTSLHGDTWRTKWQPGDEIVVTTTDYLPGHSEKLKVKSVDHSLDPNDTSGYVLVNFEAMEREDGKTGVQWPHNGRRYGSYQDGPGKRWSERLPDRLQKSLDRELVDQGAETRAAVALLTRSIQIVSAGDRVGEPFPAETTGYHYGAHMIVRQGAWSVEVQGVEFRQMGQGGRLGHYPIHFHMARKTAWPTYIKDSSINESMTRWIVLHSTQGVTLARNVGYKSIGHGFYLESGTETENKFYSNLGIFARAAIANIHPDDPKRNVPNPKNLRMVPGIIADNTDPATIKAPDVAYPGFIYRSDAEYPTVFWITNGWNDFIGNMAAGAGTCGAAYWLVPAANSDMFDTSATHQPMKWDSSGYAGLQKPGVDAKDQPTPGLAGAAPLKSFYKNYATSTMHSFQTTRDAPACDGVIAANAQPDKLPVVRAVPSQAPTPARHQVPFKEPNQHWEADTLRDHYYPHIVGARAPVYCEQTRSGYDCSKVTEVCRHPPQDNCALTVIDHFTSSFHWANGAISAIWLRPQWYLMTNSVLSDVQNGGVTFITGGDYTHSSVIGGYWGLAKSSVFIGNTQDGAKYPYTSNLGPFNALTKLQCAAGKELPAYCLNADETVTMPTSGFFTNQRLANIYDGPSYQDSNAYLDIKTATCEQGDLNSGCMYGTKASYLRLKEKPKSDESSCYIPNAAIGWKQPNGFFYPPAFHSRNLFFSDVDLRHYVINPLFKVPDKVTPDKNFGQGGTYLTDGDAVKDQYCIEKERQADLFNSFTSIDRQTVLNDDDGTLTGLTNSAPGGPLRQTISINEDNFFSAPRETAECGSALGYNAEAKNACSPPLADKPPMTARTSPYDYVATILYRSADDGWGSACTNQSCYGVPLYRQYLTKKEKQRWDDYKCSDQSKTGQKPECRWPFIRMSGENLSQRETLTINNGLYYVDTTVSRHVQETENYTKVAKGAERSLNVFTKDKTYFMFFSYAKTSTVQTYQIYVGKDFKVDQHFKPGRMNIDSFEFLDKSPVRSSETWAKPLPLGTDGEGILTVNIDFTGWSVLEPSPDVGLCQPRSFCKSQTVSEPLTNTQKKICVNTALRADDPLVLANKNFTLENGDVCQRWAMKDLDCPPVKNEQGRWTDGGCFAFSFKLPSAVADGTSAFADDTYRRPAPKPFPTGLDPNKKQGLPDWTTKFIGDVVPQSDTCFYPKVPGTDCLVPVP